NRTAEPWPGGVPGGNKADRGHGGAARSPPPAPMPALLRRVRMGAIPPGTPPVAAELKLQSPAGMNDAPAEAGATKVRIGTARSRAMRAGSGVRYGRSSISFESFCDG